MHTWCISAEVFPMQRPDLFSLPFERQSPTNLVQLSHLPAQECVTGAVKHAGYFRFLAADSCFRGNCLRGSDGVELSVPWDCLGTEFTGACEAVARVRYLCASEVSVGPVVDQPFGVMYVGREGQIWSVSGRRSSFELCCWRFNKRTRP